MDEVVSNYSFKKKGFWRYESGKRKNGISLQTHYICYVWGEKLNAVVGYWRKEMSKANPGFWSELVKSSGEVSSINSFN